MSSLKVITSPILSVEERSQEPFADRFAFAVRVAYLTALLIFVLLLQTSQATFINVDLLVPIYGLLGLAFLFNAVYLVFVDRFSQIRYVPALYHVLDVLFIAGFHSVSEGNYSLFGVLFLLNIVLCGLKYGTSGALNLALLTSFAFSLLMIFGPEVEGQNFLLGLVVNNLSFLASAYLSGSLGGQFSLLNLEVASRERDIEKLQRLNQLIVSNVATGLLATDNTWRITQANEAAVKLFESALEGRVLRDVLGEQFQLLLPIINRSKTDVLPRVELRLPGRDGEVRIVEVILSSLLDEKGENQGYVALMQDLSLVKKLEANLRQSEKLAAVGQLAAGIAHEIRNPLASISGSVQLLASAQGATETEEVKKLMNITLKEIDRLNGLISEFLEYVKPETAGNEIIDVGGLVQEIVSTIRFDRKLSDGVEFQLNLKGQKLIHGSHSKLKQALLNIAINACQAMEKSSEKSLKISTWDEKDQLCLVIADTGAGIKPEHLNRIFEPFFTTKPRGTGLGLAMTHKILESHQAVVNTQSEVGKGSSFSIYFPAVVNPLGGEMRVRKEA